MAGMGTPDELGLIYFDGDADLQSPTSGGSGVLDTMGMTHLLGGRTPQLSGLSAGAVLVRPDNVALFAFDPAELDTAQWMTVAARRLHATPAPVGQADQACRYLEDRADAVVVHFDVDVLDTGRFPLADFPHFNGLGLAQAALSLCRFAAGPHFAALVITEVNPNHDPDGNLIAARRDIVVVALAPAR
jgi:arginase